VRCLGLSWAAVALEERDLGLSQALVSSSFHLKSSEQVPLSNNVPELSLKILPMTVGSLI